MHKREKSRQCSTGCIYFPVHFLLISDTICKTIGKCIIIIITVGILPMIIIILEFSL